MAAHPALAPKSGRAAVELHHAQVGLGPQRFQPNLGGVRRGGSGQAGPAGPSQQASPLGRFADAPDNYVDRRRQAALSLWPHFGTISAFSF